VDHGSTNGTFVNGAKVSGEAFLRPGDEVQFGAIRFRYEG
jgi:pSer/pThr/pTyr-binding forkhead associated (FHA) protein